MGVAALCDTSYCVVVCQVHVLPCVFLLGLLFFPFHRGWKEEGSFFYTHNNLAVECNALWLILSQLV